MIYYVLCPSFHGATLLSFILNNHSQLFSLGDTNPTRKVDQNCSCGKKISRCEFWGKVQRKTDAERFFDYPTLLPTYPRYLKHYTLNQALNFLAAKLPFRLGRHLLGRLPPARKFKDAYSRFLEIGHDHYAYRHFIDGEKSILKFLSARILGFDVGGIIHLVRDPRAYLGSNLKRNEAFDIRNGARVWRRHHLRIQNLAHKTRYHLLVYEKLMLDTEGEIRRLFEFIGVEQESVITAANNHLKNHLIGNRMISKFRGTITNDETWRERLTEREILDIQSITEPLFSQFGYQR